MKKVRILLRVSSNQQLEADGDLNVQRQIVVDYVRNHEDWILDDKEYFEGSNSGYKNSVEQRDVLQDAMHDAINKEYDILVCYKDDRIGRLMWEIGSYIMTLKKHGVDIYTVKDGCISPKNSDDVMGQMILALRYGNAQKSSSDTGMRVKDTAKKLVQSGKFMGGSAPYGYSLELSGEVSKHGRALHKLVVIKEKAEVVKYIYDLSLNKEYGSTKIAKVLNLDDYYRTLAPKDIWKSGTITSILTNPIYSGHTAYKRRERINGVYKTLDSNEWIVSDNVNKDIQIIDENTWNKTQEKRHRRASQYTKSLKNQDATVIIKRNDDTLPLIDVIHCGYCGCKLTNGSKYNYWTIKSTGERRTSKKPMYKCQNAYNGAAHNKTYQFDADKIEKIVFKYITAYIEDIQKDVNILTDIERKQEKEKQSMIIQIKSEQQTLNKINKDIEIMESHIPEAMSGTYPIDFDYLMSLIKKKQSQKKEQEELINQRQQEIDNMKLSNDEWNSLKKDMRNWGDVFLNADNASKRVMINKIIQRIDVTNENIKIVFKIRDKNDFLYRMSEHHGVSKQGL